MGRDELKDKNLIIGQPEVIKPAGQPMIFSGSEARKLGIASYLADDIDEVAQAIDLPRRSIKIDPSLSENWRAARIDINGPMSNRTATSVLEQIRNAVERQNANFLCFWIDSPGGSLDDSLLIADYIAYDLNSQDVKTVAWIPEQARADAAIIAFACDDVIMTDRAVLGGEGNAVFTPQQMVQATQTLRESLAPQTGKSWSLTAAMINTQLEVYKTRDRENPNYFEYFSSEELDDQKDPQQWEAGAAITTPGQPFTVEGRDAVEYWLADATVENFAQLKQHFALENDPSLMQPGWADTIIRALASPTLAGVLLMVGFIALAIEMKTPGIGVGAFTAGVCFILFFWSRMLGGTAGWLEMLLFLTGVIFLVVELFVLPGFGIFGLGGGLLIIISIVLACQTFIVPHNTYQFGQFRNSLAVLVMAAFGAMFCIMGMAQWLKRMYSMTDEEIEAQQQRESLTQYEHLVGHQGRTTTRLCPSGKAMVEGRLLDVIADCELVPANSLIEIVEVQGNRIFVRPVA